MNLVFQSQVREMQQSLVQTNVGREEAERLGSLLQFSLKIVHFLLFSALSLSKWNGTYSYLQL